MKTFIGIFFLCFMIVVIAVTFVGNLFVINFWAFWALQAARCGVLALIISLIANQAEKIGKLEKMVQELLEKAGQ